MTRIVVPAALIVAVMGAPGQTDRPVFEEAAARVGLTFAYENGANGQFYMAEVMGAGAAFVAEVVTRYAV